MRVTPRLLLITGAPASGKTRLAAALGERYRACRCSKDELKELLMDRLGAGDAAWSRRLSDASFALLFALAPRLLSAAHLLLLEGNFRPGEHEPMLRPLFDGSLAESAQLLCRATPATRRERLTRRSRDCTRHPGHADARLEVLAGASDGFLDLPGPRFEFDSDGDWDAQLILLCGRLDSWV